MIALLASPNMSTGLQEMAQVFRDAGIEPYYVILGAGSQSFIFEANRLRESSGRLLPALIKKYAPGVDPSTPVVFFGYSAGCWLARDGILVNAQDRAQTAGVIYGDGLHADESQLATTRAYLNEGGKVLLIHSDTHPGGYPSTTETAARLGSHPGLTVKHSPGGHTWTSLQMWPKVAAWLAGPFRSSTEPDDGSSPPLPPTPGPGPDPGPTPAASASMAPKIGAFVGAALVGFVLVRAIVD